MNATIGSKKSGPLADIRVLDLSSYAAGPNCCSQLAEMGADVIKVESPSGDVIRGYPSSIQGENRAFLGWNRGKRGIVVDMKNDDGKDVIRRLVRASDVLVENFRPGVMDRLGLGYADLKQQNPRLIYCGIRGYGDEGPLRDRPGYDSVLQSMTGVALLQGEAIDTPPKLSAGYVVDYYTSALAALGVVGALHHRNQTGEGQYITTSLLAAAIALQSARFVWADGELRDVTRETKPGRILNIYPAKVGHVLISANTEKFWQKLSAFLGMPELAQDPRYNSVKKRAVAENILIPMIRDALMKRTAAEWEELMGEEVPCAAVRNINDLFEHPQVEAGGLVSHLPHSRIGGYRTTAPAVKFGATQHPAIPGAPLLGEHTDIVLSECGWSESNIKRLRASGAVG